MLNTTKRVLALLLALAMVFALAGCKKSTTVSEVVVYEDDPASEQGGTQSGNSNPVPGSGTQSGTSTPGGGTETPIGGVNYDELEGTTVRFAATLLPEDDGSAYIIEGFEKKYKMNVKIDYVTLDGYIQEVQGLIANGNSPDVGRSNGDFPACLAYFDSLDKAKLDFNDPIWNQNTFKLSTFNGVPYMCDTYGCYWTELDICIYSKKLLNAAGCPTPQQLAKQGKWTWDNFMNIAELCTQKMGAPAGCINTKELALHMGGGNVFRVENEKIVSGIDANTTAVVRRYAEAWKKGILNTQSTAGIVQGITAMGTGHAWSLRKDGDIAKGATADYGFYFLPAYKEGGATPATGIFRGFGVIRGASNPVGAGVFLRYYLDINNYDTENAFINEDAKTFFFQLTTQDYAENYNPYLTYIGLNQEIAGVNYAQDIYAVMSMDPSAVDAKMSAVKAAVEKGASNFNKHIQQYVYSN